MKTLDSYYLGKMPVEQLNDSGVMQSPSESYRLLGILHLGLGQAAIDSIYQILLSRFPDYPPLKSWKNPAPMSREGWRDWARIRALLGMETPPYEEPVADIIPEPQNISAFQIGSDIADVTMTTTAGILKPLENLSSDYVLLDFWASWCQACREEIENGLRDLAQLHKEEMTICFVSLDKEESAWQSAIGQLKIEDYRHYRLVQPHADYKLTKAQFGIRAIPRNVLLDKNRKIIAIDLRGEQLAEKMKELVGK